MINKKIEEECAKRLSRIKGQIEGIERMIKDRRYCVDVVMQISSAEAALHRVSDIILRKHLETCVIEAFKSSNEEEKEKKIDELMDIYKKVRVK
jgi:DNA-binding FrmR family transcriptional regulator